MATLTSKLLTMHDTVEIHSADGRRVLAEVKKQLVSLTHGAKVNVTGMQFPLEVKGDFRGKNFQVGHPAPTFGIAALQAGPAHSACRCHVDLSPGFARHDKVRRRGTLVVEVPVAQSWKKNILCR